ncbi:MAG TPA: hypothetical protein VE753_00985 [Gaiellaceae bacterium]|nr:hypothetical protein [Gaiellaceae bacterium]
MEDEREKLKLKLAQDEGEDVEAHKLRAEPDPGEDEKLKLAGDEDEGEDVEAHKL